MNILLVCRGFLSFGGSGSRWNSMVGHLSKEHKILVVTNIPENVLVQRALNERVHILPSPIKRSLTWVPFGSLMNIVLMLPYLFKLLSKTHVDLILVTIPEFEEGIACAIASRRYKKRFVIDVRDLIAEDHVNSTYPMFPRTVRQLIEFLLVKVLTWTMNSAECVVTVTYTLKKFLLSDEVKVPIYMIPNGADTTLFHPVNRKRKKDIQREMDFHGHKIILYAGAMGVEYYPIDVILDAFQLVSQSITNVRLILCGPQNETTRKSILKFERHVTHLGVLKHEQIATLMHAGDIGLISMDERKSTFCALTTKLFEYLASGMPVVAACPKFGELDQLITRWEVGYSVTPGDYMSMAERIISLLNNDRERRLLGQNGVKLVATKFDREKLALTYNEVLRKVGETR